MKSITQISAVLAAVALFGITLGTATASASDAPSELTTQRKIQGIITAVEATSLTIAPIESRQSRQTVTGRIDPAHTRILVNGKAARAADLKITFNAKAEIGLDDVWLTVSADTR